MGRHFERSRRVLALGAVLALGGCRVPREVHEPREYPSVKIEARALELSVTDPRPANTDPGIRELTLAADFEPRARARLASLLSGQGPELAVTLLLDQLQATDIVDARGEMTRVACRFEIEIRVKDGPVVRRGETQSTADLPREEANGEELAFLAGSTADDAFDRYFADAGRLEALNRELQAQAAR